MYNPLKNSITKIDNLIKKTRKEERIQMDWDKGQIENYKVITLLNIKY